MTNANFTANGEQNLTHYAKRQLAADEQESQRLRANASLPPDAWKSIDDTVYPTMDSVLRIVADLRSYGLTTSEPINAKTTEWYPLKDDHEATVAMQPETATDEGNVDVQPDGAVIPIVQSDFSIGFRDEGVDNVGGGLETMNAEASARAVAEGMEDLVVNGWDVSVGGEGYSTYGLTNHPDVHSGTLSDWSADAMAARSDIRSMFSDLKDDQFYPGDQGYLVYLDRGRYDSLDAIDNEGSGDMTVRQRVEELSDIAAIAPLDSLPANSALAFRPSRDVVDLAIAAEEQTVQWDGPFRDHFMVMSILAPRVKSTADDACGIAYYDSA